MYHSNARASEAVRKDGQVVPLGLAAPMAVQPWTVRSNASHANTLGRLLDAIESARARGTFQTLGFLPPEAAGP